jgi:predicted alpha/beta-fold hydrolase
LLFQILVNCLADHPGLIDGAVVISCPWDLRRSSRQVLERSWLYSFAFGRALGEFARRNRESLIALYRQRTGDSGPLERFLSRRSSSVLEFGKEMREFLDFNSF